MHAPFGLHQMLREITSVSFVFLPFDIMQIVYCLFFRVFSMRTADIYIWWYLYNQLTRSNISFICRDLSCNLAKTSPTLTLILALFWSPPTLKTSVNQSKVLKNVADGQSQQLAGEHSRVFSSERARLFFSGVDGDQKQSWKRVNISRWTETRHHMMMLMLLCVF